ncbi:helix-turn-helix domain-containing protein [Streptomyces sp. SCA3-4]|uniref:helix-turn-helix domain-containing protein n=1 Tax=Streptomyces sichuanensis TaxID=2871810 RepID=UPI001CE350E8|nr:helix-turn-helix domain-containing protein [Streptomyces sichuanensis]MCA6092006.1 helix-turn-helix domain-containing protein [Streptomyces sichuanensis]
MISSPRAWTLEQNDRRLVFSTGAEATLFAESGGSGVTRHHHPAWKVVLPVGGDVRIGQAGRPPLSAAGLVVPPQLTHTCAVASPYAALFIDPWRLRAGTGLVRLDADTVRRLLAALGPHDADGLGTAAGDLAAACSELFTLTGAAPAPRLDERVAHAVRTAGLTGPDGTIGELAAEVGLSPARLRALVRESVGIPLVRLRQWGRLRNAIADLPHTSVAAAAAAAGFADQAHLARTSRTLLGRTPASLGRVTCAR